MGEMEDYVLAAIQQGLKKIVFLEHLEEGIRSPVKTWLSDEEFDQYFAEGERLKQQYADIIEVCLGVECGFNPASITPLKERLSQRQWEQIGISCHYLSIAGSSNHLNLFSRRKENIDLAMRIGSETLLDLYFSHLIEAIEALPTATMLCHIDGALRHVPGLQFLEKHYTKVDQLLNLVKQKGIAVELNTSGIAIRKEPFPSWKILEMVISKSIPMVFGSDAHKPADVCRFFAEVSEVIPLKPWR